VTQREANILWLRDMIEHLSACQKQLEWAEDTATFSLLTEAMLRDLERCRQLCTAINRRSARHQVTG
jgi:hypothetical protein